MSEDTPNLLINQISNCACLDILETSFPNISRLPIDTSFLNDPAIKKLVNLIKFSIPVHTYQPEVLALYDRINQIYYDYIFRNSLPAKKTTVEHHVSQQDTQKTEEKAQSNKLTDYQPQRKRINYLDLARFIESYNPEMEVYVNQEVIRQGQRFQAWETKEITVSAFKETPKKPKERYEKQPEFSFARDKVLKGDNTINITIGKNISREVHQMKKLLIKRAESNRLLEENTLLTDIEKVQTQVNFILNRITEEYFEQFLEELIPYATHQLYSLILAEKIIEKILEEHNFIKLYSKLIKRLRKSIIKYDDKPVKFKTIFIQRLQLSFYRLIRKRQWTDREELYKKQLIGFSIFLGQLIHIKILSKFTFPDIFFELISSFIHQYREHQDNKNFYYHETYVECIIKVIEAMGDRYNHLLLKTTNHKIQSICDAILAIYDQEDANFYEICDFIEVLRELNKRMPSQRFKISFLLEDFRCSKALKREVDKEQNNEYEIVKDVLAIDHTNAHYVSKISGMISKCDPKIIMKDYYFQFAQGNAKQVSKNIETFKMFMHLPNILDAALTTLKENLSGLSMIDADFPFLAEGLAKVMKQVCDHKQWEWRQLELSDPDEDITEFIERIEGKYFKMIIED